MSTQVYYCEYHDETFEIQVPFKLEHPPKTVFCELPPRSHTPEAHPAHWRPSAAFIIVKEGTGAAKRSPINHA